MKQIVILKFSVNKHLKKKSLLLLKSTLKLLIMYFAIKNHNSVFGETDFMIFEKRVLLRHCAMTVVVVAGGGAGGGCKEPRGRVVL